MAEDESLKGMPKELIPLMAKKIEAQTRQAVASARAYEIDLEKKEFERERMLAGDFFHKTFYFDSPVNEKSVGFCMDQLDQWSRLNPEGCEIEIAITSPGGSVVDGLALFDHIKYLQGKGNTINTVCLGIAASMGGILLQAGTRRIMSKESWLLIHQISAGVMGSFGEIEDRVKWIERTQERVIDIFARRSSEAEISQFKGDFASARRFIKRNWERTDWWIDSDEALKLGLVDEVR